MNKPQRWATTLAILFSAVSMYGQEHSYYDTRHEVAVAIGAITTTEVISGLADMTAIMVSAATTAVITGGNLSQYYSFDNEHYIPSLSAEYYYHFGKVVGVGGFMAFNGMTRDMYLTTNRQQSGTTEKVKAGKASRHNLSIIPAVKFDWLRRKHVGLYSKVGIGASLLFDRQKEDAEGGTDDHSTTVIPNFQITPLGFEAGSLQWRGFLELGLGEQGLVSAGARYKF